MEKLKEINETIINTFNKQKSQNKRLWNLDEKSQQLLYMMIRMKNPKRMLEIGTSNGYSAFWWSLALENCNGILDTIEAFEERYNMAKKNLESRCNVNFYLGKAEKIIPTLDFKYDFVFIDAGKIGYIDYVKLFESKLNDGAIVIADNTVSHAHTVHEYLTYIRNSSNYTTMELDIDAGLEISIFSSNWSMQQ
jgi:predicted O-methyltransferase YrrM